MTIIILKDSEGDPLAVSASEIIMAEKVDDNISAIHVRVGGSNSFTRFVSHPVDEIAAAINKTMFF